MNRNWLFVFLAGFLEIFWVSGLKHADNYVLWGLTILVIITSFCLLTYASKTLPIGTLYAVFAGIGTAGTVIVEMIVFGEPFNLYKILLIVILLSGVMGLKMISSSKNSKVNVKEGI
ncbi:DMT family transporter [Alkalicoccobacillus plakortidis]|uniref:Multidrug efflux SMR transporter n=1 Tax=Alkalicoccobacillus plakortidis TaxID=444060 RepID=A0ABT0XNF4_9BACI|nr:multidrug efflux SMR transporter [Alkalicoccobacillus plakortidis]MCM2677439.1 multidrug efflux SMR transporter [Alkalicoccobacillus plakortidis]